MSNLLKQLEAIDAFVESPAYSSFRATITADLLGVEQSILLLPPVSDADRAEALMLFGRRAELTKQLSFFEEARSVLEAKLSDEAEPEQQGATTNIP